MRRVVEPSGPRRPNVPAPAPAPADGFGDGFAGVVPERGEWDGGGVRDRSGSDGSYRWSYAGTADTAAAVSAGTFVDVVG
ncbi:hypothetical protein ACFTY8_11950 [Streptomyces mirabilis]|uniref:hypothetical protein n=1 Tax=Streptomyces mirabilis TaxID=68239 RepID=UPI00362B372C